MSDPADMGALLRRAIDDARASGRYPTDAAVFRAIAEREGRPEPSVSANFRRALTNRNASAETVRAVCEELDLEVVLQPRQPTPPAGA